MIDQDILGTLAAARDAQSLPALGRSLAACIVGAGDCGACALELALLRPRLAPWGITVQDSPVGADLLLVTGALTPALIEPLQRALQQMAQPRWVFAIGDCARHGGPFAASPVIAGGIDAAIPVDLAIPGCPPAPDAIRDALETLLAANA